MPLISSASPDAFIGVAMQSAFGTPNTTLAKFRFAKYLEGTNVEVTIDANDIREGGDGLDFGFTYKRRQMAQGQIVVNARPDIIGQLLMLAPGGATWDGASAPALHKFHSGHASHPYFTLQAGHPGTSIVHFLSDAKMRGFTIEGQSGEPIKVTFPFVAVEHGASSAVLAATYHDHGVQPFLYYSAPTYIVDGAGDSKLESFTLGHEYGSEEIFT